MTEILDTVSGPADLKKLDLPELRSLADEIRQYIIDTVSQTGGHLAASLGVVELTIALHYVFNAPEDKIIWDVGHQTYAHKIITGRRKEFTTLRRHDGISGFPKREESPFDAFNVGHSSTSISAAVGMARARTLHGQSHKVIAVIGDAAFMAGMAFEGFNYAGHINEDVIVILNDNEMSISSNVGALSSALSRIISGQAYNKFRNEATTLLKRIPSIGESVYRVARQSEGFFKSLFVPGLFFEELGFIYIGPVLGHRLDVLIENIKNVKNLKGPILLHVVTKKGCGYAPAEADPTHFHGVGAFDKKTGKPLKKAGPPSYTQVFGETLTRIAADNPAVVAITAGMATGTGLPAFMERFPDRFFDVGIAEQHAITFAAGMAAEGLHPVAAIYSTFLQRSYDQILHDVCLQNLPVVFGLDRAGIVGEDGPTHHGLFDISFLRPLPNLVFLAPKDENELQHMLCTAFRLNQPAAIRYPRGAGLGVSLDTDLQPLPIGRAEVLRHGGDLSILAIGATVHPALEAAELLAVEGIRCTVVNSRFIKPLDEETILACADQTPALLTVEENVLQGGFGSAVLEVLQRHGRAVPARAIGIPDIFVEHGSQAFLRAKYGLDRGGIFTAAQTLLQDLDTRCARSPQNFTG